MATFWRLVLSSGGKQMLFNAYILPTIPIDPSASEVLIYLSLRLEEVSAATFPPGEWILCKERETFEEKTEGGRGGNLAQC